MILEKDYILIIFWKLLLFFVVIYLLILKAGIRLGKLYSELYKAGEFNFNGGMTPTVGAGGQLQGGGRGMLV